MENKKLKSKKHKSIKLSISLFLLFTIIMAGAASAKSLYVNKDLNANSPISAYDIQPAPTYLVYQMTSSPTRYGGAGLAIDTDSETLFVTFEGSGTLDIVDAKTLAKLGQVTAPGASNLAGIVVDQDKQKVYTTDRGTNKLYVYSWDATTKTLTLDSTQTLSGVSGAYGIALDEVNDLLYVGDLTTSVKIFKTSDWSSAGSFTVSQKVMGVAVDVANGFVYTGNAYGLYGSLGLLSKYDLNTNTETTVDVRALTGVSSDNVLGLAVDPDTSLLYITTGNQGWGGSDQIMVFDSNLNLLHTTGDIGNPTGIVVPGKEISYNPLNISKTDGVTTVCPGDTLTYKISYSNINNPSDVTNVTITDTLPAGVTFVSATGGGTYGGGVVTWNLGTLTLGTSGSVEVTVKVNPSTIGTITNSVTIDSDQTPPTTKNDIDNVKVCVTPPPTPIPEFPSMILPIAGILAMVVLLYKRREY